MNSQMWSCLRSYCNVLLLWGYPGMALLVGCGTPVDEGEQEGDGVESVGQLEQSLSGGFTVGGCNSSETQRVFGAMDILLEEVTTGYSALLGCVSSAVLVEYRGRTPRQIVDNLASSNVTSIQCANLDGANGQAPVSISGSEMKLDRSFLNSSSTTRVASVAAHELMHNRGYSHSVNAAGSTYYSLTVPEQVERCVRTRTSGRVPNSWPGPGSAPAFTRIVGAHANNGCNCVYLRDGYATCGATDYLSRYTNTYRNFTVAPGRSPANIVGMTQTGSLVCAFYNNGMVSCGTQSGCNPVTDLDATRAAYSYTTAPGQSPGTIVGMGGDDGNNRIYAWYSDRRVSSGTSDDLDRHRALYGYDLAGGYAPGDVAEMLSDGSFNCVLYRDGMVSCGTTDDLESSRRLYESKF